MKKKLYIFNCLYLFRFFIILLFSIFHLTIFSQEDISIRNIDIRDTILEESKKGVIDTISASDSSKNIFSGKKISKDAITEIITYQCVDSIRFQLNKQKAYLYTDGKTFYNDMQLDANYIEIDFQNNELYACGVANSEGKISGNPVFQQGETQYNAYEIKYNFTTQKGKITKVITTEGEGYVHGKYIKKISENAAFISKGEYTTCNLPHPHFQIKFNKAKFIQNEKIITGAAYLSFGDIPTFLAIPFGYFPMEKKRASGILMPTFGQSTARGFYFENFGYYFGISDNFDLALQGDITTRGNWAAKVKSNYVFRYKCSGQVNLSFSQAFTGERHTESFSKINGYKLYWSHKQDAKSNPNIRFSALINVVSASYNLYNNSSASDYLSNQYSSSVNFSSNIKQFFFFDVALSYSQNTQNKLISFSLPTMNMSINQIYPFRKKNKAGKMKWYDNISIKWSAQVANQLTCVDSLFLTPDPWKEFQTGMQHTIPLTIPVKLGKYINWNTNVNFTEKWYLQNITKDFSIDTNGNGIITDQFNRNFFAIHDLSLSSSLTSKIYIMWMYKKGALKAIRHVITPNLSFTYRPNLSGNTYGTYFNTITGQEVEYSYFASSIYGGATSSRQQAIAKLSFGNNVEMKIKSKKDTITGTKKIAIFDNLSLNTGYDFAADSMNWQALSISGRTALLNFLDITFNLGFDPYIINEQGIRVNQTEWQINKRFWRFSSTNFQVGVNWRLNRDFFKGKQKEGEKITAIQQHNQTSLTENTFGNPVTTTDYNNNWNLTINYTFSYSLADNYYYYTGLAIKKYDGNIIQTLNVSGDLSLSKKWKIGFTTGYDFTSNSFSYTSIDFYRDLHCWEMKFNWIPFGTRKGWNFTINVKASVLQDLKYNMKRDFRDNIF